MPSHDSTDRTPRAVGPVEIRPRSVTRQLCGFVLAFVGYSIVDWAASPATPLVPTVLYTALGTFVVCNGLYVGGVRFR